MEKTAKIYVAGHRGMVGSAIMRELQKQGYENIVTRTHAELDLLNQPAVFDFFAAERPEYVFLAAARVGGIVANEKFIGDFLYQNVQMEINIMEAARVQKAKKLLFLASSCIYPRLAPQPLKEEYLLTGPLEATNEGYAIAKITGIKMCEMYNKQYGTQFVAVMPTNLYGPGDNFHPEDSHLFASFIRKFFEAVTTDAPEVTLWGSGKPRREFLHVDDMARGSLFVMNTFVPKAGEPIFLNLGTGKDTSVLELAELFKSVSGYKGNFVHDLSRPDGTPQKLLDISRIQSLGWEPRIALEEGVRQTFEWYRNIAQK